MVHIKDVWLDDAYCDENGMRISLSVFLSNGASIMIYLDSKASDPLFFDILKGTCSTKAKTDGSCVYWENGASISLKEMIDILQADNRIGVVA